MIESDNIFAEYANELNTARDAFILDTVRSAARSLAEQMQIYRVTLIEHGFSPETAEWAACQWAQETHFTHTRAFTLDLNVTGDDPTVFIPSNDDPDDDD